MRAIEETNVAYIDVTVDDARRAGFVLSEKLNLGNFKILENGKLRIYDPRVSAQDVSKALALNGVAVSAIGRQAETLEDYFLKLTSEVETAC